MLSNPLHLLARLPAPVQILVTGTFINKVGTFIVPFLTLVLLREFHLTETQAGALLFAYGVGPSSPSWSGEPSPTGWAGGAP